MIPPNPPSAKITAASGAVIEAVLRATRAKESLKQAKAVLRAARSDLKRAEKESRAASKRARLAWKRLNKLQRKSRKPGTGRKGRSESAAATHLPSSETINPTTPS